MKIGILSKDADTVTLVTQLADRHACQLYSGVEGFAAACADRADLVVLDLDDLQRHQHAVTMLVQQHRPPAASKARPVVRTRVRSAARDAVRHRSPTLAAALRAELHGGGSGWR